MGVRMRALDWAATPLGDAAAWPQALQTLVGLMLASNQPMFLAWGPQRTWLYNDAWVPMLGNKHPAALGQASADVWAEAWDVLEPLFDQAFAGVAVERQGFRVALDRFGRRQTAVFDFSYTPVALPGHAGAIGGLFGLCTETTGRLQPPQPGAASLREALLVTLQDSIRDLDDPNDISFTAAELLGRAFDVSRAGYGTIHKASETIVIERDWNAPGIQSIAGTLHFRDYGSYIEQLKAGVTVAVTDARDDPRTAATADALKAISAQSFINMPVTEQGDLVALFFVNHAEPRRWTSDELALMRDVAERTRVAVERRRAEEQLRVLAATLGTPGRRTHAGARPRLAQFARHPGRHRCRWRLPRRQSGLDRGAGACGRRRRRPQLHGIHRHRGRRTHTRRARRRRRGTRSDQFREPLPPPRRQHALAVVADLGRRRPGVRGRPRRHRAEARPRRTGAGAGSAAPVAEDGSRRPADRRHRARLQQPAGGHRRQPGTAGPAHRRRPCRGRRALRLDRADRHAARRIADAAAAGVFRAARRWTRGPPTSTS